MRRSQNALAEQLDEFCRGQVTLTEEFKGMHGGQKELQTQIASLANLVAKLVPDPGSGGGPQTTPTETPTRPGGEAPPPPSPVGGPPAPRPRFPTEKLQCSFDGSPEKLKGFMVTCVAYMGDWGEDFPSEAAKVRCVGARLTGDAAVWWETLLSEEAPELTSLDTFMATLEKAFSDQFVKRKAMEKLHRLRQGTRSVKEYTAEFRALMHQVGVWEEDRKIDMYTWGLAGSIFEHLPDRSRLRTLDDWVQAAYDSELTKREITIRSRPALSGGVAKPKPRPVTFSDKVDRFKEQRREDRLAKGLCLRCGKEGHFAAKCPTMSRSGGGGDKAGAVAKSTAPARDGGIQPSAGDKRVGTTDTRSKAAAMVTVLQPTTPSCEEYATDSSEEEPAAGNDSHSTQ